MVALEAVGDDADELRDVVARHLAFTGSAVAERLLADWDAAVPKFVRVMPLDYKRVLDVMAAAAADGLDEAATMQRVMEAAHG